MRGMPEILKSGVRLEPMVNPMELDDIKVSRAIIDRYFEKLRDNLETDVIIAGAGPASLAAA